MEKLVYWVSGRLFVDELSRLGLRLQRLAASTLRARAMVAAAPADFSDMPLFPSGGSRCL